MNSCHQNQQPSLLSCIQIIAYSHAFIVFIYLKRTQLWDFSEPYLPRSYLFLFVRTLDAHCSLDSKMTNYHRLSAPPWNLIILVILQGTMFPNPYLVSSVNKAVRWGRNCACRRARARYARNIRYALFRAHERCTGMQCTILAVSSVRYCSMPLIQHALCDMRCLWHVFQAAHNVCVICGGVVRTWRVMVVFDEHDACETHACGKCMFAPHRVDMTVLFCVERAPRVR